MKNPTMSGLAISVLLMAGCLHGDPDEGRTVDPLALAGCKDLAYTAGFDVSLQHGDSEGQIWACTKCYHEDGSRIYDPCTIPEGRVVCLPTLNWCNIKKGLLAEGDDPRTRTRPDAETPDVHNCNVLGPNSEFIPVECPSNTDL